MRYLIALLTAVAMAATACQAEQTTPTAFDDGADGVEVGQDRDGAGGDAAGDATSAGEPTEDDSTDAETTGGPEAGDAIDPWTDHPIEAQPGRWAVADAGFVEFDLTDGGLVLIDVTAADGWTARVDEEDADEIEVDFVQGSISHEIEIELDDRLEVDVRTDIEPADPGVYELGAAGSVEFAVDGGALRLVDVVVADGWQLRIDDESADEIELIVARGPERWDVEIELDDGRVELEIDYRVRGER
jgi:hypothetical protein